MLQILGTRLGTTFHNCRLFLETETDPGTKSCFQYLCVHVGYNHLHYLFQDTIIFFVLYNPY